MAYASEVKELVLNQVKKGVPYSQIGEAYNVPKSTISTWVRNENIPRDKTKQREHLKRAREKALVTIHANKETRREIAKNNAEQDLAGVPLAEISVQKALLAMLYWAEGTKGEKACALTFVNTYPLLISLYISLLRNCFPIDEPHLRIRLHLGYWHDSEEAITFWSELLKVPRSQFGKIYVKKRSTQKKFRKNFRGICFVIYGNDAIRREVLNLGRLLAENN
jgi:hypothetical protein